MRSILNGEISRRILYPGAIVAATAIPTFLVGVSINSVPDQEPNRAGAVDSSPDNLYTRSLPVFTPEIPEVGIRAVISDLNHPKPLSSLVTYARLDPTSFHGVDAGQIDDSQFQSLYTDPELLRAAREHSARYGTQTYLFASISAQRGDRWVLAQQQAIVREGLVDYRRTPTNDLSEAKGTPIAPGQSVFFNSGVIMVTGFNANVFAYTERGKTRGYVPLEEYTIKQGGYIQTRFNAAGDYAASPSLGVAYRLF